MTNPLPVTRRKLLASTAVVASSAVGFRALVGESVALTDSATAGQLRYRWRETYNGDVRTDTEFVGGETPGPQLSVDGVLPGDRGTLTLAIEPAVETDPLQLTLLVPSYANHENGVSEPEQAANDGGAPGDLGGAIEASLWYDAGVLGVGEAGGQNARKEATEPLVTPDATGSLDDVAAALGDGVLLSPDPFTDDPVCLTAGESVVVTLSWKVPEDTGNRIQGDSVSFSLAVTSAYCGGGDA